jgi:hypothetical protein
MENTYQIFDYLPLKYKTPSDIDYFPLISIRKLEFKIMKFTFKK